jgi:tRNA-Thr(GGU) m(6)t(6)A37 methyltransferase TsaA
MAPRTSAVTGFVEQLPPGRRGRGGVVCFPPSVVLRLEAAVGDDPARVAIRKGLAFGKAPHAHLSPLQVAERGQATRVRPRVEPPYLLGFGEPATPTRASADGSTWAAPWAVPAAGEQTVVMQTSYGLVPIGWVQSALRVLDDAPNQREGAPRAWIRFDGQVAEGAKDLRPGDEIVVLTWLHLSPRDELSTHPEDDMSQPLTGVFSTCSPNRPNPIGLHRARIVAREGLRIEVDALEAIDGTPVVDVKPAIGPPA